MDTNEKEAPNGLLGAGAGAGAGAGTETDTESETDTETESETGTESDTESDVEAETEAEREAQLFRRKWRADNKLIKESISRSDSRRANYVLAHERLQLQREALDEQIKARRAAQNEGTDKGLLEEEEKRDNSQMKSLFMEQYKGTIAYYEAEAQQETQEMDSLMVIDWGQKGPLEMTASQLEEHKKAVRKARKKNLREREAARSALLLELRP